MGFKLLLILAILFLIAAIIYGSYLLYEAITRRMDRLALERAKYLKSVDMEG
jgi:hypothetical protein